MTRKTINSTIKYDKVEAKISYSLDEMCPVCGVYSADGDVCINCQKEYGIYEPKLGYCEGF